MAIETIFLLDDEPLIRQFLSEALKKMGYTVTSSSCGEEARSYLNTQAYDVVLTDLKLPDCSGLEILKLVKEKHPQSLVVVMTAYGTIETAVEAMKLGAFHYLLKPFSIEAIEAIFEKASEHCQLVSENLFLKEELQNARKQQFIAQSPLMQKIRNETLQVAKSHANVFISGESGTGKEVIAGWIVSSSLRANKPYIKVNCAAIAETLMESEFFGHEKGAFTGAINRKPGRFELANGGTLLLDEVTEIPFTLQPKLLRAIQEKEFERVGGIKSLSVDVRILSTTNRNLKEALDQKVFREDLYYRLNVISVKLPPLRDRREDILPLANYFLSQYCQEYRKAPKIFSKEAEKTLLAYEWRGNIRELTNVVERLVVLDSGPKIAKEELKLD